jgi:hypothetical protein
MKHAALTLIGCMALVLACTPARHRATPNDRSTNSAAAASNAATPDSSAAAASASAAAAEASAAASSSPAAASSSPAAVDASGSASSSAGPDFILDLPPEEQATEDVEHFIAAYYGSVKQAQLAAVRSQTRVTIEIDRDQRAIVLRQGEVELARRKFAASLVVLKVPTRVEVLADKSIDFVGRDYHHPHPTQESAHVLARVPGFPLHAFIRFTRGTSALMMMTVNYEGE